MAGRVKPLHPDNQKARTGTVSGDSDAVKKELKAAFIEHFKKGGALYWAASKIGRSADTIENWRKEDPDFDTDVVAADKQVTDTLVLTAFQRAIQGSSKNADALLMFLIKGREPKYRDHFNLDARHLHAGAIGTSAKVPTEVRELLKGWGKELLKTMAEKL